MTKEDLKVIKENRLRQTQILEFVNKFVKEHPLDLQSINTEYLKKIELECTISADKIDWKIIDKTTLGFKKKKRKRNGDKLLVDTCEDGLKDLAISIQEFVRELHPNGEFYKSEGNNRFTNYQFNDDKVFNDTNLNFVSIIPQKKELKIFVLKGDYIPFVNIDIIKEESRYYYFKICDSFQLPDAKDAIEISFYHWGRNPR